ncbi:MAG: YihY family inner membrane protein [Desulfuromonadales bacterium]|nr:YihY family inner membrane protein [Desulfuromonadales bacterium]
MVEAAPQQNSWKKQLKHLVWEQNPQEMSWLKRTALRQLQMVVLVSRDFYSNRSLLRASALTYYTLLSLVPFLALTFALLKAFGVQNQLEPLILEKLNVGDGHVAEAIVGYINNTQVAQMGAIGLVFLLVAVISLLTNIEAAFNDVWGVNTLRPLLRRFSDYLSVILVGPVLLIGAISMTSSLISHSFTQNLLEMQMIGSLIVFVLKVTPFIFMWLAFTLLYVFMSNIKVQWRAALIGGVVGGTLWQIAQLSYVHFQVGVARYNAIYGTMAALPIFMIWLYVSWVIVLFGLGVCYAKQNLRTGARDLRVNEVSRHSYEQVALALLVTLADRFHRGDPAINQDELAKRLYVPPRLCRAILAQLECLGLIIEISSHSGWSSYQLGRDADNLSVADIYSMLRNAGEEVLYLYPRRQTKVALDTCSHIAGLVDSEFGTVTLKDLVLRSHEEDTHQEVNGPVDRQKEKSADQSG